MILRRAALLLAVLAGPAAAECTISMRMDQDPPYLTRQPDGTATGINVDVAREAFRRMGCKVEFRDVPFGRALRELQEGTLGVVSDMFETPDRESFALFSKTGNRIANRLYVRLADKDRWKIESYDDLPRQGIRLGIETGALASPDFKGVADAPAVHSILVPARTHESLWRMLAASHVDAVIMDDLTALTELRQLDLAQAITGTGFVASIDPAHFAFSRALFSSDDVHRFDETVAGMRRDGTVAKILVLYGIDPGAAVDIQD